MLKKAIVLTADSPQKNVNLGRKWHSFALNMLLVAWG